MGLLDRSRSVRRKQSALEPPATHEVALRSPGPLQRNPINGTPYKAYSSPEPQPTSQQDMRRPSLATQVKPYRSSGPQSLPQEDTGRSGLVTQAKSHSSPEPQPMSQDDFRRPSLVTQVATASVNSPRNNPLPTPEKPPMYQNNSSTSLQTIHVTSDSRVYLFPSPSPGTPQGKPTFPTQEAGIGIALGSPRRQPLPHVPNAAKRLSPNINNLDKRMPSPLRTFSEPIYSTATGPVAQSMVPPQPTKLRKTKSRSFRGLFASKAPTRPSSRDPPVPSVHRQTNRSREDFGLTSISSVTSTVTSSKSGQSKPTGPIAAREQGRAEAETKMESLKQNTAKRSTSVQAKQPPAPITIKPPPVSQRKANYTEIKIPQINVEALASINAGPGDINNSSFLNVDIPRSEMERYSIMFEKLLKPRMSLAERRGTISKLRPLGEEGSSKGPSDYGLRRRATSPSLPSRHTPMTPSPDIVQKSIQAATQSHIEAANRLLQMHRKPVAPIIVEPARNAALNSPAWSEASLPLTPDSSTTQTFPNPNDTHHEPIISPPASERLAPTNMTSRSPSPNSRPPAPHRADSKIENKSHASSAAINVRGAGQVSVARQISLSRANSARPQHLPVAVKQPLRPRVVRYESEGEVRRSTMVQIESV